MIRVNFLKEKTVRIGKLMACTGLSLLLHLVTLHASGMFGRYDLGVPVQLDSLISLELKDAPPRHEEQEEHAGAGNEASAADKHLTAREPVAGPQPADSPLPVKEPYPAMQPAVLSHPAPVSVESNPCPQQAKFELLHPLRLSDEFTGAESETLTYRIYLLGVPVGSAVLQARRDKGDVWLTLKVASDAVFSSIYPVDDFIETRHINGNFIITRIRQKEGSFSGDRGFTLFLRDKSVFWIDRLANKSVQETLPNSEVVDLLSGLYYLRNRQLQVGKSETLHIYDSDTYAAVPVDVLERETIRLPDFSDVPSVVIQPKLETEGIFKNTGDIRIWLSDDEFRVPVKIATSIDLGRVTAELVSAESKRSEKQGAQK